MHDPAVSLFRIVTVAAWLVVTLLIAAAWSAFLGHRASLAQLLGLTGCAVSAVAATLNIRCYSTRLARLARALADVRVGESPRSLHSLTER